MGFDYNEEYQSEAYNSEDCQQQVLPIADAINTAIESGDIDALVAISTEAIDAGNLQAIVEGIVDAIHDGADCDMINYALKEVSVVAESFGEGYAFAEAVAECEDVSGCLGIGVSPCRGSVQRSCCSLEHPQECACAGNSCRASINDASIPVLDLYIYNDVGDRICKC
eukprot:TRINITY_DN29058_c0_g1_i1.p1 TRINITY_DN29058_c0_g1~~TRINITY_DN29058_c0_g1_i1.p1  ORF type:complete len:168 (-),score=26.25 TRINITY_DN29058_c0_g1_i1:33-536(-)